MLVIGINHKTAELCFRELLSFSKEVLQHALSNLFMFTKNILAGKPIDVFNKPLFTSIALMRPGRPGLKSLRP